MQRLSCRGSDTRHFGRCHNCPTLLGQGTSCYRREPLNPAPCQNREPRGITGGSLGIRGVLAKRGTGGTCRGTASHTTASLVVTWAGRGGWMRGMCVEVTRGDGCRAGMQGCREGGKAQPPGCHPAANAGGTCGPSTIPQRGKPGQRARMDGSPFPHPQNGNPHRFCYYW